MPSLNYDVQLTNTRRLCVNACEGQIVIVEKSQDVGGKWLPVTAPIVLTDAQAVALVARLHQALDR